MGPKEPRSTVFTVEEEAIVVAFRRHTLLALDDCLYDLQPMIPHLTRSSLHRCLERHGISRLPEIDGDKPKKQRFATYAIDYVHVDIAEVSTAEGKLRLFLAIDRTSKFAFARLVESAGKMEAAQFPRDFIEAVPYRIHTVLTDNSVQFTSRVARRAGVSRPAVWRWQQRFAEEGVEGLLRDKTRPRGTPPHSTATVATVLALTCSEPPDEVTHWTGRAVAARTGISLRSVQRIWQEHRLQPHRVRTFKRSHDPAFAEKLEDVVGLYMQPPAHAVVLSIDEKSQIQALERTRPDQTLWPGHPAAQTHDYTYHGTTTLFAALDVLEGTVLGRCMQRHRHGEFIRFLNTVEAAVPAGKAIHVMLDNYGSHKHPKVRAWLTRHPRWTFHFTLTSASWLNAVEGFFSTLTRRRLRRGTFTGIVDLQAAIKRYIGEHNRSPRRFVWTKPAAAIFDALNRAPEPSV